MSELSYFGGRVRIVALVLPMLSAAGLRARELRSTPNTPREGPQVRDATVVIGTLVALLAAGLAPQEAHGAPPASPAAGMNDSRPAGMRLEWTCFVGGSGEDNYGAAGAPILDRDGMLYFAGLTASPDFPVTANALHPSYKGTRFDTFLLKFNTRQPGIAYSTFLPGVSVSSVWLDPRKNIYLAGLTGSSDHATTTDALTRQFQGGSVDGFLTILGDGGRTLKYSTYIGGPQRDRVMQVVIEPSGEIMLIGSSGFGTQGSGVNAAGDPRTKDAGAFIMRLDATGRRILSRRVLGDLDFEGGQRLASGDWLIKGSASNGGTPTTPGSFDRTYHGAGDLYVARLSSDLETTRFATLFGGTGAESFPTIATVPGGDFFVFGTTSSKDLPVTVDAIEKTLESKEAVFLARFSGDGRQLKYCTYLGARGSGETSRGVGLFFDGRSRIYLTGNTSSVHFPVTADALQPSNAGGRDLFLLAFNIGDNSLAYGSYLGGSKDEGTIHHGVGLAFDESGAVYGVGVTYSDDFPQHERSPAPRRGMDVFISKFSVRSDPTGRQP